MYEPLATLTLLGFWVLVTVVVLLRAGTVRNPDACDPGGSLSSEEPFDATESDRRF